MAHSGDDQDLSDRARRILAGRPDACGKLVVTGDTPTGARALLDGLTPEQLLAAPVASSTDAEAMLAGLWLWHDALHESHEISQSISSATGSFWHAILHRREGDFSNSKYWNARCRRHPAYADLASDAAAELKDDTADRWPARLTRNGWDPDAFVDLVEAVHDRPDDPAHALAVRLQRIEWRTLFDHCARAAVASSVSRS